MHFVRNLFATTSLAIAALGAAGAVPVTFDWFEYTGRNPAPAAELRPGEYRNPILTGFYPDPSICQVGGDYYLINSTFAYFPGIPIFHSRDLVNWKQIGHAIHRPQQLAYDRLGVSRGIFAPAISHHNGTFYIVCTMADAGGNFVVTAQNPAGPWSDPTWLDFEGIDPSIFFDDDGRAWMLNNGAPEGTPLYNGHRAIWIQEFDPGARRMVGPRKVLVNGGVDLSKKPVWIEGPHIFKRDGWYYLCCAEGGTSVNHSQVILRSRAVDGPYTPWDQNPILTQRGMDGRVPQAVTSTGHADLVIGPDQQWWAVFLGIRPYEGRFSMMGRETFLLPVSWNDDGWPRILEPGKRVPLAAVAPAGVSVSAEPSYLNGDFTWRDDFNGPELSPFWFMLRAPVETWWKLDRDAGRLALTPRAETLAGQGNPSFVARRVQHAQFTASTSLEAPGEPGVSAGLAVFQGEQFHYFLAVKRHGQGLEVSLEKHHRGPGEVIKSVPVDAAREVALRVEANDGTCSFSYAMQPGAWQVLAADQDAKLLTTEVAGGFVGATVGLHVRKDRESRPPTASAGAAGGKHTFVIVHGAWAGGWEHKKLAEALQAEGHTVYRPTLTGQGERFHLASPDVDLALHIQDVVNFIEWEDLHDVVLVGHSYGGMVITGVADRVPSRLKHVIYLDAFLPENGESAQTARGSDRPARRSTNGFFSLGEQTGPVPHIVPQSEKTFTQPITLEHQDEARRIPTTYILTVDPGKTAEQDGFFRFYERARARDWKTVIMTGDHVVHLTKTQELVRLLAEAP